MVECSMYQWREAENMWFVWNGMENNVVLYGLTRQGPRLTLGSKWVGEPDQV